MTSAVTRTRRPSFVMLAAHGERPVPGRTDDAYLRHLFDRFASDFDTVLKVLAYRVPDLLETHLSRCVGPPVAALDILDAGCGTGLCGQRLRPWACRLTGVDISAGMLARARDRSLYDELAEREFTSFLTASARRFDLVVAGDVLCYFGDLSSITSAIARWLAPGGRLFLTLEKNTGDQGEREPGYRLQPHGRYCHAQTYVARVMANTGLEVELLTTEVLRQEAGESVTGLLVGLRQPAGGDRP